MGLKRVANEEAKVEPEVRRAGKGAVSEALRG
jgi:hypothetical protein